MNGTSQNVDEYQDECTLVLCEYCYGIILEDVAENHEDLPYCHDCIRTVQAISIHHMINQ